MEDQLVWSMRQASALLLAVLCVCLVDCAWARQGPAVNKQRDERNCKGPEGSNPHDAFADMVPGNEFPAGQPPGRRVQMLKDFGCQGIRVSVE